VDVLENPEFVGSLKALPNSESPPRIIKTSRPALMSSFERNALETAKAT
jgi:hypothetical protein